MRYQAHRERLAELLESLAAGAVSADEAMSKATHWRDLPRGDKVLSSAFEHLMHFCADADIRANSPGYADMQHKWLLKWARRLRGVE